MDTDNSQDSRGREVTLVSEVSQEVLFSTFLEGFFDGPCI